MPATTLLPSTPVAQNGQESSASSQVDEEKALERLLEVSSLVLAQAVDLVDNSLVSDEQLTAKSQYIPGSTIGVSAYLCSSHYPFSHPPREAPQACTRSLHAPNGQRVYERTPYTQLRRQKS